MRVVITGAATGIGAATVRLLAAEEHHITAFDIEEPGDVDRWIAVDLRDPNAVQHACSQIEGPIDVLINNAGLPPRDGNAEAVLRVNVFALRAVTRALLPKLSNGARVVNTASRAGMMWQENIEEVKALLALEDVAELAGFIDQRDIGATRAYNLSKEAVIAYTKAMARSLLARDIRMNSVSPAPVATGILDDFLLALGERAANTMALLGRAATPEEIARVIVFLARPENTWIKGEDILVDGGISAISTAEDLGLEDGA